MVFGKKTDVSRNENVFLNIVGKVETIKKLFIMTMFSLKIFSVSLFRAALYKVIFELHEGMLPHFWTKLVERVSTKGSIS